MPPILKHLGIAQRASITSTLNVLMEEIHKIKNRPLIAPRKLSIRAIDQLQTILLVIRTEFVVISGMHCQRRGQLKLSLLFSQLTVETKPKRLQR